MIPKFKVEIIIESNNKKNCLDSTFYCRIFKLLAPIAEREKKNGKSTLLYKKTHRTQKQYFSPDLKMALHSNPPFL
jgi:hypothetical protein